MLLRYLARCSSSLASSPRHSPSLGTRHRRIFFWTAITTSATVAYSTLQQKIAHADHNADINAEPKVVSRHPPMSDLLRSYVVYSFCAIPIFVDWAPTILSSVSAIPVLKQVSESLVRHTFFRQFVGGDSAEDTLDLIRRLRKENKGVLLAYSVEVDEAEAAQQDPPGPALQNSRLSYMRNVEEMIHCVDVAADFEDALPVSNEQGRRTWVAVKLSALVPSPAALIHFSEFLAETRSNNAQIPFPGMPTHHDLDVLSSPILSTKLSQGDIDSLDELRNNLLRICRRAEQRGVKIIIDAEYTWFQPAIDAYGLFLMKKFNQEKKPRRNWLLMFRQRGQSRGPLIYVTFQAYLRRTPNYLDASIRDAAQHKYALGVKLVRGAYHPHELERHRRTLDPDDTANYLPPVWINKTETDQCYEVCSGILISALKKSTKGSGPDIGILFGTHNWRSATYVLDQLVSEGLATVPDNIESKNECVNMSPNVAERLAIGQLYGMSDSLTDYLTERIKSPVPPVIKYVPYGGLAEVMPYLSRRAIENKSVLGGPGGATEQRELVWREIRKQIFG